MRRPGVGLAFLATSVAIGGLILPGRKTTTGRFCPQSLDLWYYGGEQHTALFGENRSWSRFFTPRTILHSSVPMPNTHRLPIFVARDVFIAMLLLTVLLGFDLLGTLWGIVRGYYAFTSLFRAGALGKRWGK